LEMQSYNLFFKIKRVAGNKNLGTYPVCHPLFRYFTMICTVPSVFTILLVGKGGMTMCFPYTISVVNGLKEFLKGKNCGFFKCEALIILMPCGAL